MDDKLFLTGMVTLHAPFSILGAPFISQEWLKLETSNFVDWFVMR